MIKRANHPMNHFRTFAICLSLLAPLTASHAVEKPRAHTQGSPTGALKPDVNPEFAGKVYDTITPGSTVIITDQPVVRARNIKPFFES